MQKAILAFAITITTIAGATAFHLASLPNPTEAQKALSNTANTIAISGTGTVFAMLNSDRNDEDYNDDDEA